jgi:hypothetical protein
LWSNRCAKAITASDAIESPRRIDVAGFRFHILIALIERHRMRLSGAIGPHVGWLHGAAVIAAASRAARQKRGNIEHLCEFRDVLAEVDRTRKRAPDAM